MFRHNSLISLSFTLLKNKKCVSMILCLCADTLALYALESDARLRPNSTVQIFTEEVNPKWKCASERKEADHLNVSQLVEQRIGPLSSKVTCDEHPNYISDKKTAEGQQTRRTFWIFAMQHEEFDEYENRYIGMNSVIQPSGKDVLKLFR